MNAFKCDRCGQFFEGTPKGAIEERHDAMGIREIDVSTERYMQLCKDCVVSFVEWATSIKKRLQEKR